jgi:hypothetical protein
VRHLRQSVEGVQADLSSYSNLTFESEKKWSAVWLLFPDMPEE